MVGTRSPADEDDVGAGVTAAGAAADPLSSSPSPSAFVNEVTLDALVVEFLKEEQEEQKVSDVSFFSFSSLSMEA